MLTVVALDPSITSAGFAHADGTEVLKTKSDADLDGMRAQRHKLVRQRLVRDRLMDLAERHGADLVVLEGYAFNQPNAAVPMGELGGILRDRLFDSPYAWVVVPPNSRAKYATGSGNASKDEVIQAVAARRGATFKTTDECDAWVLRQMALAAYGLPVEVEMPKAHLDALTGVDWPPVPILGGPFTGLTAVPVTTYKPPPKKKRK